MIEYSKAMELLEKWKQHDIENSYNKGMPDYPTNTRFIRDISEAIEKRRDGLILNILHGKQSRISGIEILKKVVSGYLGGTDYTVDEVIEIMGIK